LLDDEVLGADIIIIDSHELMLEQGLEIVDWMRSIDVLSRLQSIFNWRCL